MTNTKYSQVAPDFSYVRNAKTATEKRILGSLKDKNDNQKLSELSIEELSEMIYNCEKIALACRYALQEKDVSTVLTRQGTYIQQLKIPNDLVPTEDDLSMISKETWKLYDFDKPNWNYEKLFEVDVEDEIIKIKTPLTFKKFYGKSLKYNYILIEYLKEKLLEWQENNYKLGEYIETPFCIAIIRKSIKFEHSMICDNDNMENGRIINAICDALVYSDNPVCMDLYSCFRKCENEKEQGMEFWIFSQKNKLNFIQKI